MADFNFVDFFIAAGASFLSCVLVVLLRQRYYLGKFMRQLRQIRQADGFRFVSVAQEYCWLQYRYGDEWITVRDPEGDRVVQQTPQALIAVLARYGITSIPKDAQEVRLG